jgi:hypothetical protein
MFLCDLLFFIVQLVDIVFPEWLIGIFFCQVPEDILFKGERSNFTNKST